MKLKIRLYNLQATLNKFSFSIFIHQFAMQSLEALVEFKKEEVLNKSYTNITFKLGLAVNLILKKRSLSTQTHPKY